MKAGCEAFPRKGYPPPIMFYVLLVEVILLGTYGPRATGFVHRRRGGAEFHICSTPPFASKGRKLLH